MAYENTKPLGGLLSCPCVSRRRSCLWGAVLTIPHPPIAHGAETPASLHGRLAPKICFRREEGMVVWLSNAYLATY